MKSQDLDSVRNLIIRIIKIDYLEHRFLSEVIKGIEERLGGVIEYVRAKTVAEI